MHVCCVILTISLGQLITMAGLDKTTLPFSAKPPGSSDEYINSQSRLDTTQQMRAILENSHLDESIMSADMQPVCNGWCAGSTVRPSTDPTQQYNNGQVSVSRTAPGSKFDELYQQALRNAESILSDSGNPPDEGHVAVQNLYSPVRSVNYVPSDNETLAAKPGLPPATSLEKSLNSAKPGQNGRISSNNNIPQDSLHSQKSHHSVGQQPSVSGTAGKSQDVDSSVDSERINETEVSAECTSVDDDIEEIILNSH